MFGRLIWGLTEQWCVLSRSIVPTDSDSQHDKQLNSIAQRAARKMRRRFVHQIVTYSGQGTAMVVGCLRPYVLVNVSLFSGLTPEQLEQILTHELAHVYRLDPLTQVFQRLAESIMFFHPACGRHQSRGVAASRSLPVMNGSPASTPLWIMHTRCSDV